VAEAAIRYLIQGTAQRLAISGLSKRAWTWAMRYAAVARNKLATRQLDDGRYVTPHELLPTTLFNSGVPAGCISNRDPAKNSRYNAIHTMSPGAPPTPNAIRRKTCNLRSPERATFQVRPQAVAEDTLQNKTSP
jgi:hypothetical protein